MLTKQCSKCEVEKLTNEFFLRSGKDGFQGQCKECRRAYHREWERLNSEKLRERKRNYYRENPERKNEAVRKYRYGITSDQFDLMLVRQENSCALCSEPFSKTPCVDHDHKTGRVRGLLCHGCNNALGSLEKLIDNHLLSKGFEYLEVN